MYICIYNEIVNNITHNLVWNVPMNSCAIECRKIWHFEIISG